MTTLNRLLESVFEGKRFESAHDPIPPEKIDKAIKQIPFTLSDAQKSSIFQAFSNHLFLQGNVFKHRPHKSLSEHSRST